MAIACLMRRRVHRSCGTGPIPGTEIDRTTQFSEELRAASSGSGPLQWVGECLQSIPVRLGSVRRRHEPCRFRHYHSRYLDVPSPTHIRQEAVFGEGTYAFTDKFNVTVELGGTTMRTCEYVAAGFGSQRNRHSLGVDVNQSNNGLNPSSGCPIKRTTIAGVCHISKGFRPGGGNQPLPTQGAIGAFVASQVAALGYANGVAPLSYGSDAVWSYEIGEKTSYSGTSCA